MSSTVSSSSDVTLHETGNTWNSWNAAEPKRDFDILPQAKWLILAEWVLAMQDPEPQGHGV